MTEDTNAISNNDAGGTDAGAPTSGRPVVLDVAGLGTKGTDISTDQADRLVKLDKDAGVPDILQHLGAEQSALLVDYQNYLSSLTEQRELPPGEYLDALDEDKKAQLLLDKKLKAANERRAEVKGQYERATKAAHERLEKRKETLREELFDVDANTVLQVTLAADGKLEHLVNAATRAGSNGIGLAKALLPTIHERGLDELSVSLLAAFPTLAKSWREWQSLPHDEVLARQTDPSRIEQMVPQPTADRLRVRPRVTAY